MRRIARIVYQRRWEILTFLGVIWVLLFAITRNLGESLVITIYTAPITLLVFIVIVGWLYGGIER
jgi:hypothetical protein